MSDENNRKIIDILEKELVVALGCTEPASIAYVSSIAQKYFKGTINRIEIECSTNIIKNVHGVSIPNTNNRKGIKYAVAAGIIVNNCSKKLKILDSLNSSDVNLLDEFVNTKDIKIIKSDENDALFIKVNLLGSGEKVSVELKGEHTNIIKIIKNDIIIFEKNNDELLSDKKYDLNFDEIYDFVNNLDSTLIPSCIENQVYLNYDIGKWGLLNNKEINIGQYFVHENFDVAITASASEARMSGCDMPVIINSGSGNQGLIVSLPIISYAKRNNIDQEVLYRAIMLSNLLAIWQKQEFNKLSAFCGAVNAAAATGAAITWLRGGNKNQIKSCINNTLASIAGIYCDGAKVSCAFKVAISVENAILASSMVMNNKVFHSGEGLIKATVEETIHNTASIVNKCSNLDNLILDAILN
ncbi:MAG: serine dehydratase subunit alpha family protein [Pleomorphochaeta sp.]